MTYIYSTRNGLIESSKRAEAAYTDANKEFYNCLLFDDEAEVRLLK